MSKIKIMDVNKVLVEESNVLFDKILTMQSEADSQIRDIRTFDKKILDIQKKKQIEETLLSEKIAMQKIIEAQRAQEAKEKERLSFCFWRVTFQKIQKKNLKQFARNLKYR